MERTRFVGALAVIVNGLQTDNSSNQLFCPRTKETHQYRLHPQRNVAQFFRSADVYIVGYVRRHHGTDGQFVDNCLHRITSSNKTVDEPREL